MKSVLKKTLAVLMAVTMVVGLSACSGTASKLAASSPASAESKMQAEWGLLPWVQYTEKHHGEGSGGGSNVLNPVTIIHLEKGATLEMETVQIEGVDSTKRVTKSDIADDASLIFALEFFPSKFTSNWVVALWLPPVISFSLMIMSRSVARGTSTQYFYSVINGNNLCAGHSECDAIIMDQAMVKAVPDVTANHVDATLIHKAAIGKIAGEQIMKLRSLGMDVEEAEQEIVNEFLK